MVARVALGVFIGLFLFVFVMAVALPALADWSCQQRNGRYIYSTGNCVTLLR